MKKGQVYVVFDRKYKVKKGEDGTGTVDVFVYLTRSERKYVAMGKCKRSEFETFSQKKKVQAMVRKCEKVISALSDLNLEVNLENFNTYFERGDVKSAARRSASTNMYKSTDLNQEFIPYMQKFVDEEELGDGTRAHKQTTINALKEFGKIKTFADLVPSKILAFDKWLHNGVRKEPSIYNYHKNLHKVTRFMRMSDMIPSDPYNQVPIKRGKCKERKPLTEKELCKLRELKLEKGNKLDKVRDLFIFAAYTGMAFCDVMLFDFKTMTVKVDGMYYIDGFRIKTQGAFFTPILQPAMDVLKKYNYKLPRISNQKANDYLHLLQDKLGIRKNMTFHVARHSFATLVLSHDVPIEDLAKMLGHKDIKVTQIYAKILNNTIERHSRELQNKIL